jgi:hypothetical protein
VGRDLKLSFQAYSHTHPGLIAQEVKACIEATGRTLQDLSMVDNDSLAPGAPEDSIEEGRFLALGPVALDAGDARAPPRVLVFYRLSATACGRLYREVRPLFHRPHSPLLVGSVSFRLLALANPLLAGRWAA